MKLDEVTWLDAQDKSDVKKADIKNVRDHLVSRTTVGYLAMQDEDGVVLIRDIDELEVELSSWKSEPRTNI